VTRRVLARLGRILDLTRLFDLQTVIQIA